MGSKRALVLLAEGAEEMEAVIAIDILRRAEIEVTVAGMAQRDEVTVGGVGGGAAVRCSRGVVVTPDQDLAAIKASIFDSLPVSFGFFNVIVIPGGMGGARAIAASPLVGDILRKVEKVEGVRVAAICAGPVALAAHGVFKGAKITSHPSVREELVKAGFEYSEDRVCVDGRLVTSRGPGTAFEFALKLVELVAGKNILEQITPPMILKE